MRIKVTADCLPTEDPDRVMLCVRNLFPDISLLYDGRYVSGETDDISLFISLILEQRVRYSLMEELARSCVRSYFAIRLNKQAAFVSRINTVDEDRPLGCIKIEGRIEDPLHEFERLLSIEGYITSRHGDARPHRGNVE